MDESLWAEIKRMFFVEKKSKRAIASLLHIDRGTVRRAIKSDRPPGQGPKTFQGSKLDAFKPRILEVLKKEPTLSAIRVLEEIKKEGYKGGLSILKDHLKDLRGPRKESFVRIETLPGEQAQVDWGSFGKLKFGDYSRPLSCFVMVLSFSRMIYLEFTLSQRIEDFIRCHINAFKFFDGVPKTILYDNLKSVVLWRYGKDIRFNPKFMEFAGTYLFTPALCRPGRGSDKGKVESGIKYVRGNFWAGREFTDFFDLNRQAREWRDKIANQRIHGTTREKPAVRFLKEKDALLPLPPHPYDASVIETCKATSDCRIKFDSNLYSVPYWCAHKILTLKASPSEVKIFLNHKQVAVHKRSYLKYQVIENPAHVRGMLKQKQRARPFKTRDEFLSLGKEAEEYFKGLLHSEVNLTHHLSKILELRHQYGKTEIVQALSQALQYQAFGAQYIQNIIIQNRSRRGEPVAEGELSLINHPELAKTHIQERDLQSYEKLIEEDLSSKLPNDIEAKEEKKL